MMSKDLIGNTIDVYVDDMLVKFKVIKDHIEHLGQMFEILRKYQIKLNPLKYAFEVGSRKFLSFMVNQRGIEVNPEKTKRDNEPGRKSGNTKQIRVTGNKPLCTFLRHVEGVQEV